MSAQNFPVDTLTHKITFTETLKVDSVSKIELFKTAKNWFELNFQPPHSEIKFEDENSGVIGGKGSFKVHYTSIFICDGGRIYYSFIVYIKEGEFKYEITDIIHDGRKINEMTGGKLENKLPQCGKSTMSEYIWQEIKSDTYRKIRDLIQDFVENMLMTPKIGHEND